MKILDVKTLAIPDIKVIQFTRFSDDRGYFTEPFRRSDLKGLDFLADTEIVQANESVSKPGVIRGLHFQWNPYMGKLVRTVSGRMVDLVLDIRKGSPSYGQLIGYDMPANEERKTDEWIWVPPGFAHGNYFTEKSKIEYLCTGEYSQGCEAGISPLSQDIKIDLMNLALAHEFFELAYIGNPVISEKDKNAPGLEDWGKDQRSENFVYGKMKK